MQLTPADTDEHPLAQLVCRVGEHDGCVKVAALAEHPEEVCGVKIVEGGCDKTAPYLKNTSLELFHCSSDKMIFSLILVGVTVAQLR